MQSTELLSLPSVVAPIPLSRARKTRSLAAAFRLSGRHVLTGAELSTSELGELLDLAALLKKERKEGIYCPWLANRQLALFFEKPSLRTRVSFTIAMQDFGGHAVELVASNVKREEPEDTARVLAGFCHGIMARVFSHSDLERMASVSKVPVINGLSDMHHPCQALADALTLKERFGSLAGLRVAYIGDGNNVLHSLLMILPLLGAEVRFACPEGYGPNEEVLKTVRNRTGFSRGMVRACKSPAEAASGADALYTDVWTSMGFEKESADREKAFAGYCVDEALLKKASPEAVVMHCLPMVRGKEISETLPEHPRSVIFQQSENRLHAQKALLLGLMG